jgi:hypothetical protein
MEFYIRSGEAGASAAMGTIRRIASLLPATPTLVTPCLMEDWCLGAAQTVGLQRMDSQWQRQVKKGDHCIFLELRQEDNRHISDFRRRGIAVLGALEASRLSDRRYRKLLRKCDAVLAPDTASYCRAKKLGLRRVFFLTEENDEGTS